MVWVLVINCSKAKIDKQGIHLEKASNSHMPKSIRLQNNFQALAASTKLNDSANRTILLKVAGNFYELNENRLFRSTLLTVDRFSKAAKDTISTARSNQYLGTYYRSQFVYDSAYFHYVEAKKLFTLSDQRASMPDIYCDIAQLQYDIGDYTNSELSLKLGLQFLKSGEEHKIEHRKIRYRAYTLMGNIQCGLLNLEESLLFHNQALDLIRTTDFPTNWHFKVTTMNNIANAFINSGEYKKAIPFIHEGLNVKNLHKDRPDIFATLHDNLGYSNFKLGHLKEAEGLYLDALKVSDSLEITNSKIRSKIHLSELYAYNKDTVKALFFANSAYKNSLKNKWSAEMLMALEQLISLNTAETPLYSEEYMQIEDSLKLADRVIKNRFARIAYETAEITDKKDVAIKSKWLILGGSIILTTIVFLLFKIRMQRAKQKQLHFAQHQQESNNKIYELINDGQIKENGEKYSEKKRIARDLHDGVMNQLASTRLNLFILSKKQDDATIAKCLTFISNIESVEKEIGNIAHDLMNDRFSIHNTYNGILKDLIGQLQRISKTKLKYEIDSGVDWATISGTIKMNLYRILQETVQNAIKYANAQQILIAFFQTGSELQLTVSDDGVGFDSTKVKSGIGLKNITERINSLSGNIEILSGKGNGTTIIVNLPLEHH